MWVLSLGWEDSLEEGMAAHSNILAWRIPWTEEPWSWVSWIQLNTRAAREISCIIFVLFSAPRLGF